MDSALLPVGRGRAWLSVNHSLTFDLSGSHKENGMHTRRPRYLHIRPQIYVHSQPASCPHRQRVLRREEGRAAVCLGREGERLRNPLWLSLTHVSPSRKTNTPQQNLFSFFKHMLLDEMSPVKKKKQIWMITSWPERRKKPSRNFGLWKLKDNLKTIGHRDLSFFRIFLKLNNFYLRRANKQTKTF